MKFAKQWCVKGNGPIAVEFQTYRYHGHSMSDPGVTYRTRDEVNEWRTKRDPIEFVRHVILDNSWATEKELKDIEKKVRADIDKDIEQIKKDPFPSADELYKNICLSKPYIRGVEYELSSLDY